MNEKFIIIDYVDFIHREEIMENTLRACWTWHFLVEVYEQGNCKAMNIINLNLPLLNQWKHAKLAKLSFFDIMERQWA